MAFEFSEVLTTEAQLRALIGNPSDRVLCKQIGSIDEHARAFLASDPMWVNR